jgi:hypothetical protein
LNFRLAGSNNPIVSTTQFYSDYILVKPSTQYTINQGVQAWINTYDINQTWINPAIFVASAATPTTFTTGSNVYFVRFTGLLANLDTTQLELFINGQAEGTKILNATSLGTTIGRPFQQAPLRIPKGAMIKWKQLA